MATITSANTVFTIAIPPLYATPQRIQQYSAEDLTDGEAQEMGDTMMGVDGVLTGGYVNVPFVQTISLMADSPSNDIFDTWRQAEDRIQDKYVATGLIVYVATGRKVPLIRGFLTSYKPVPAAKRLLQPRAYTIRWQRGMMQPL